MALATETRAADTALTPRYDVLLREEIERRQLGQAAEPAGVVAAPAEPSPVASEAPASDLGRLLDDVGAEEVEILETPAARAVQELVDDASSSPAVRLVNAVVSQAVLRDASDIHIEPGQTRMVVRLRIDGVLQELFNVSMVQHPGVIGRLKILANLDIAERRLPQDGKFRLRLSRRDIDLRVSTLPTSAGEKAVVRVLDATRSLVGLERLGLATDMLAALRQDLRHPNGLILVTGPTGSGKTTTLYSGIAELDRLRQNISTIENPVEYDIPGIHQVPVDERAGLSFEIALRALLRQDPDIILLGEIRDARTARTAVEAALTGHLVLSTLHTNDAPGALIRLIHMGVEPYLVASAVISIIAQRLVRTCCRDCRGAVVSPTPAPRAYTPAPASEHCPTCGGSGYKGRRAIYSYFRPDDGLREQVATRPEAMALRAHARRLGMKSLAEDGARLVADGVTTIEEVLRVTGEDVPEARP